MTYNARMSRAAEAPSCFKNQAGQASGGAKALPQHATFANLLGVDYAHIRTTDGGDLYLTAYGQPFWEHLLPENWYAKEWFEPKRQRLVGTSVVYKVPTRAIGGRALNLVVKWSRVGEEVPLDTLTINKFINAEFNSPFEEFTLLMELRDGRAELSGPRIHTQKPLAIFVPSERLQIWQTGRSESRIAAKLARHPGIELDILRQYVVLYGWIKGLDLTEAADAQRLPAGAREALFAEATALVTQELRLKGYRVVDMKPAHIIVRRNPDGSLLRRRNGGLAYALVDYELLERTPEREAAVRQAQRQYYLRHMARRFEQTASQPLPANLHATSILGVDYIYGPAESTGGRLWVVGKDPALLQYFLPERWRRTPKETLSATNQVFKTRTKDNIHLVWRVSRVGDIPEQDGRAGQWRDLVDHGFNSPFEEFAFALELSRAGVRTTYPRAIYMTGHKREASRPMGDPRRYAQLAPWRCPDGQPVLSDTHEYICIWGFWNGPDELLAQHDGAYYRGVNAQQACDEGLISQAALAELMARARWRLHQAGFQDLNLKPDHLLISFSPDGRMVLDTFGKPDFRLCNFEFVRPVPMLPRLGTNETGAGQPVYFIGGPEEPSSDGKTG